jgi:hypothetical protein
MVRRKAGLALTGLLFALSLAFLWTCGGGDRSADRSPAGDVTETEAPAAVPAGARVSAPFDIGGLIRRAHFAYRLDDDSGVFTAGHATYAVAVSADGEIAVSPRLNAGDGRVTAGTPLVLATASIARGALEMADAPYVDAASDGSLTLTRDDVVERLANGEAGIEQSWWFERAPAGGGDLVVRVRASGMRFAEDADAGLRFADPKTGPGMRYGDATWIDAADRRTQVAAEYAAGEIRLRVPESVLAESAFPARLDPLISPEFGVATPGTGNAPDDQNVHCMAFDGTNTLVVWQDEAPGPTDLYGARVSPAGAVLDPVGFAVSTATGAQANCALAFDGTNYLAVWSDTRSGTADIYGARITTGGTVLDASGFAVSTATGTQTAPALAFGGSNYVAVWEDGRSGTANLYGARISTGGVVQDASGIAISTATGRQGNPDVAYDGTNYLAVWEDYRAGAYDIYGARVDSSGSVLDASGIPICTATGNDFRPALAYDGTNYLVAWWDERNGSSSPDIYAARVSAAGALLDASGIAVDTGTGFAAFADVAFDGTNFLIVWHDDQGGSNDIFGARVSQAGALLDSPAFLISGATVGQEQAEIIFDGTNYLVSWLDYRNGEADIYAARVSTGATVLDASGLLVSRAGAAQVDPAVAWGGTCYLVVWEDYRNSLTDYDLYAARVSVDGTPLDPSGIALAAATSNQANPRIAFDGTNFLVLWEDWRTSVTTADVWAARISQAGAILDPTPIVVASTSDFEGSPSAAFDGTNYLIVWDRQVSGNWNVYGARMSPAGTILDGTPITISAATNRQGVPKVVFDGTNHFVVWEDFRNDAANADIYGARVTPAGTVLDASGIVISNATGGQLDPALAFDGTNSLVVWEDRRSGAWNLYGARVAKTGTVMDASGLAISTAGGDQTQATVAFDGTNYVVAWDDTRGGGNDIYASWVTPGGVIYQPGGTAVSADAENEKDPVVASAGANRALIVYQSVDPSYRNDRIMGRTAIAYPNGTGCTQNNACATGFCVDGVCCDTACGAGSTSDCQACDLAGSVGTCSYVAPGTVCRAATDVCDAAETCTGAGPSCPANVYQPSGTLCRAAAGVCDVAETCTGGAAACPVDQIRPAGYDCRAVAGTCDVLEECDGSTVDCPAEVLRPNGYTCRASAGVCDVAEACTGSSPICPDDGYVPGGTECRASAGICDAAEACSGFGVNCPPDLLRPDTYECRAVADVCDVAENCTGASIDCPADALVPVGTECRAVNGPCDVSEACTGADAACPADGFVEAGTLCRDSAGICDVEETCTGSAAACPVDGYAPEGTLCREAAGVCDVDETCSGDSVDCPLDAYRIEGTVCRAAAGECDVAEMCTGSDLDCPADEYQIAGVVCRPADGPCDEAETCPGGTLYCPEDRPAVDGTGCDDGEYCNGIDSCQDGECTHPGDPCQEFETCNEETDECDTEDRGGDDDDSGGGCGC